MSAAPPTRVRCKGRSRHWFTLWGYVGVRSPVCVQCDAPNPKWDEATMRADYEFALEQHAKFRRAASPGGEPR